LLSFESALGECDGGLLVSRDLKTLLRAAVEEAGNSEDAEERAAYSFAAQAVTFLRCRSEVFDVITLLAAMRSVGRILFLTTRRRRQLLAGVEYFELLGSLASRIELSPPPRSVSNRTVCYLASEISPLGGHTRVLEDFIRLSSPSEPVLVLTNLNNLDEGCLRHALREEISCPIYFLEGTDLVSKVRAGERMLNELAPSSIIEVGHPYDPIIPLLLSMSRAPQKVHVHHVDHGFSFVPRSSDIAVALLFEGAAHKLRAAGIDNLIHLPVTCRDPMETKVSDDAAPQAPAAADIFTTATSGSREKFEPRAGCDYSDLLQARYRAREGRHVHFGPLEPEVLESINALLSQEGRDADFIHVPFVPYLSIALAALKPNVYVGSYPMGGKRASIEAMAAGCPITAWDREGYHSAAEVVYPEYLSWSSPAEFAEKLSRFASRTYDDQSKYSRRHFEKYHSERLLKEKLHSMLHTRV